MSSPVKYFLGIDPGLSETGFGIIQSQNGELSFVGCGIIKTPAKTDLAERLHTIKTDITEILKSYPFSGVGLEELFFHKNVTNGIKVAQARGVIVEKIFQFRYPTVEFTPLQVKHNICGYGGADKIQIQEMVKQLLHLDRRPKPYDAADALAIAICAQRTFENNTVLSFR